MNRSIVSGLEPAGKVIELNRWIKAYAECKGHVYPDYFSVMVDDRNGLKSEYTYDEVHPTEAGYRVMGPLAEEAIIKAMGANRTP